MAGPRAFADTNVFLYLLSADSAKADRAEAVVLGRPVISVQVRNELVSVTRRKLAMSWDEITDFLLPIRAACVVESLTWRRTRLPWNWLAGTTSTSMTRPSRRRLWLPAAQAC